MADPGYRPRETPLAPLVPAAPRRTRPPRRVFVLRRVVALLVLLLVLVVAVRACGGPDGPAGEGAAPSVSSTVSPPSSPSPSPNTAAPSPIAAPASTSVAESRPVEMAVPSIGLRAGFEAGDCRVVGEALDPATLRQACAYTSPDRPYSLPGSAARDVVVIAGHTGAGVPAVFNSLYDGRAKRHNVSVGDVLYLRTEASGGDWLTYVATDLHEPKKDGLAESAEIWGTGATPGRLLTISCIQPANPLADSVQNAVVGWRFDRVVSEEQVRANMGE